MKILVRAALAVTAVGGVLLLAAALRPHHAPAVARTADAPRAAGRSATPASTNTSKATGPYTSSVKGTLSPPLRDLVGAPPAPFQIERALEDPPGIGGPGVSAHDPVVQRTQGARGEMPGPSLTFAGLSNPVACAGCTPPDVEGDVGPNHYVEWVNTSYAIYDKAGVIAAGYPKPGNLIFSALGAHDCATFNSGDPLVLYDQLANRWVLSQFTAPAVGPYYQCVAVSTTPDPGGAYCLYPFQTPQYPGMANNWTFPDYGKIGMWKDAGGTQDGYFFSFAGFPDDLTTFTPAAMAVERSKMLTAGCPAAGMAWFDSSNSALVVSNASQDGTERILPSDLDGMTLPPAGEPNYYYTTGLFADTNSIEQWEFHVDWGVPANATFTLAHTISVPAYDTSYLCYTGVSTYSTRDCIPQPAATTNKLDLFIEPGRLRPMWRAAYRNFGTHRSVVFHHAADVGPAMGGPGTDQAALRWYELRDPEGTPTAYQASTYAPDATHRWMGSMAQDNDGNIAIGYSVSSSMLNPSIRWAGQLAAALPGGLNTLTEGETDMFAGSGVQTSTGSRWGDYSAMSVDPVDDCTFWYINEYYAASSATSWSTRVGKFKYPTCTAATAVKVQSLTARWQASRVVVSWRTGSEAQVLGYNLYRSAGNGPSRKLNRTLIAAKRAVVGAAYRFTDRNVRAGVAYTYRLQVVDIAGKRAWYSIGSAAS